MFNKHRINSVPQGGMLDFKHFRLGIQTQFYQMFNKTLNVIQIMYTTMLNQTSLKKLGD